MDNNLYTVTINKEGVYQVVTDADAELKVRVQTGGGLEVENALPGTPLTLTVTPGLGYTINAVQVNQNDGNGLQPLGGGTLPAGALVTNTATEFKYTFTMPAKHLIFKAAPASIPSVNKVAYVSQDGWNSAGYDSGARTADSWGTASTDLQKVINSWTGSNFDEIWVHGTVTPKTFANTASGGYTITSGDNRDKAFVIPPGLRLYGGFRGTETAPGTIKSGGGNDKRDKTLTATEDWRQRTVLSGALDSLNKAYHVIIMADIPDDQQTVLDGFTVTGGMGSGPGMGGISVKAGYSIDKQCGAGMYLVNASPVIRNLRVQDNTARLHGGGIYNLAAAGGTSSPRISHTVISRNSVLGNGNGGGVYLLTQDSYSTSSPQLEDLIIELNQTIGNGGGLYMEVSLAGGGTSITCAPTITGGEITGNSALYGGGVYNGYFTTPTFTGVAVLENTATLDGGGMVNGMLVKLEFAGGVIRGNTALGNGGGVCNSAAVFGLKFTNTTIAGNRANRSGGGVYNQNYELTMTNATISGNSAGSGGGLYNDGGAILTNVRLEKNSADGAGGGIANVSLAGSFLDLTVLVITNGIIRDNVGDNTGGIYNCYYAQSTDPDGPGLHLALTNVLVADNKSTNMYSSYATGGIRIENGSPAGGANGTGISVLMNNVTLANNRGSTLEELFISPKNDSSPTNAITAVINNSIIWGDGTAPIKDDSGRVVYHHSLVKGLTLDNSGASMGYTSANHNIAPAGYTDGSLFTNYSGGGYTLGVAGAPLVNDSNSAGFYPATADSLLAGMGLDPWPSAANMLKGDLHVQDVVYDTGYIDNDATAALGDRLHTTTLGAAGDIYGVNVTNTPPSTSGIRNRTQGSYIDIGAYEKQ
jgi:hypothetical protein